MSDSKTEGILKELRVSMFDDSGTLKSLEEEMIPEIETALEKKGYSATKKAMLLPDLFGRKWRQVVNEYFANPL